MFTPSQLSCNTRSNELFEFTDFHRKTKNTTATVGKLGVAVLPTNLLMLRFISTRVAVLSVSGVKPP